MIGPLFELWRTVNVRTALARRQQALAMKHLRKFAQERNEDEHPPRCSSSPATQRITTETVA